MKNTIYLDASAIVALCIEDHPYRDSVVETIHKMPSSMTYAYSFLGLDESIYVLHRSGLTKKIAIKVITEIIIDANETKLVSSNTENQSAADYLWVWNEYKIKPRDALHLHIMNEHKIKKILTLDKDFVKLQKNARIEVIK